MRKTIKIPICLLWMIFFSDCSLSEYEVFEIRHNGNLEGTVLNAATNQPIRDVTVYYDYYLGDSTGYPDELYYDYIFKGRTFSDEEGRFLLRNLDQTKEYIIVLRKWPGFEQQEVRFTPDSLTTVRQDFPLDSSEAAFAVEPASLHFNPGEESHYLILFNHGDRPFNWHSDVPDSLISRHPEGGTLPSGDAEVIFLEVDRELIPGTTAERSIEFTIQSTGESRSIPVSVEK